jgi:hypothetical protein
MVPFSAKLNTPIEISNRLFGIKKQLKENPRAGKQTAALIGSLTYPDLLAYLSRFAQLQGLGRAVLARRRADRQLKAQAGRQSFRISRADR